MPPSRTRDEYKKPKEIVQKTKRCGTLLQKNRFLSLSRKEDSNKAEMNTRSFDRNIKIPKQNSNSRTLVKNVKYLQENPATSNRMKAETHKDNTFLRVLKNNLNAENVMLNLESRGKAKKCNKENCICYCKEENCLSKSSMKSSSEILSSSRKDKPEKMNHQRLAKQENTKSNILQQTSPKLYHKSLHELHVPSLINFLPTRFYQEKVRDVPRASILYGKTPNILPYMVGDEKKFVNIGVPFENRPNFLARSNAYNQYQPIIHQNLNPCPRIVEENRVGSPVISTTSSSTSYIDATTITQTESDLESIKITEKDQKDFSKLTTEIPNDYVDVSINSEMETNFYPNYSNDVTEESSTIDFSNSDETIYKLEDSTESIKENQDDNFSKLMPFFTNYVDRSRTPSIIYPSIMHNEKLINMEECIKLFGRDVCVLSVTSPEKLAKQAQNNNINKYSTIRIPEYIVKMSTKEGTTLNNINNSDKLKTTDTYIQSKSSTSRIKTSNVDSNEHLESTSIELNVDADENFLQEFYTEFIKQTYEPDDDYDENKLFHTKEEDTRIPMKKLDQITDKTMETARNTQLGKSKSHIVEPLLNPNNKETTTPTPSEKYLYSTNSYEYSNDKETNSWSTRGIPWNTLRKEETTTISYDFKTEYNFKEENKNYLNESNNIYSGGEISQELKEENTTINHDSKIGYNFEEEITNRLIESGINTSREKEILQGQSEETTTISHDSKAIYNFEEESMHDLKKLNTNFDPEKEILQEQFKKEITPISSDSNTEYNFEEVTENDLLGIKTVNLGDEIFREQPEMQYLDSEETDYLNNKEDTINSLDTIIDSSSRRLPFCDNTLLLNSIRKVINDFASNASLAKTKDLDENILQIQGKSLLPEILQVPNLESILLIPQIENTIVEKVKDVLSDITAIPRRHLTNDWSHDVIKNTFRSILQALSADFHRKLPPMTVEEHQFKDGQWTINSITLAPVSDSKLSLANPENLRESIRNLLNSSAIASQIDQYIVRNIIVQSVKNSLTKDEHEEINNSIIHELNNILQTLKDSENTDVLGKNNRFIDNKKDVDLTFPQEISLDNYEKGINIGNSILIDEQNLDIENNTKIANEKMQMTSYQKSKALENNASVLIVSNVPDLAEYEKDKSTYIEEKTPSESIYKINENVRDQILNGIQKIDMQDDEVKELAEPLKSAVTYHKAISQNNLSISAISVEPNLIGAEELSKKEESVFSETTTISSIMTKNFDERKNSIVTPRIKDINASNDNNKSLINRYSLDNQILKYIKNYRINDENVQVTIIPSNFIQKTSPNYAQISDGNLILKNMMEIKDNGDETEYTLNGEILTKSTDNLIPSTNVKYRNEKSKIATSTDEIDPAIILERIEHNLSPIKYYSPEILKYIVKSHRNNNVNRNDDVKVTTAFTSFMQETSPDYAQMSDGIISQNTAKTKNVGDEMECISNDKILTSSADNVISSLNIDYGNYESKITSSIDKDILDSQQHNFKTQGNVIDKIHEVTTEVQRTYAKTTYFKIKPSADDSPRISSSSSVCKADANSNNNENKNSDNYNDSDNLIGNKMYNTGNTETDKVTVSPSESCFLGNIYPLQLSPSLIASDISQLEKSQLYYISDSMKLPLEIRKLKDGSYALSITKNICEILKRKCSCCVPLQGHVILSWNKNQDQKDIRMMTSSQEDMYVKNIEKDYHSTESPNIMITLMTTGKNTVRMQKSEEEEEEEGRMSAHDLWKRNLNDNNLITILMPVIDFAKKYLLLDSNKEETLFNETGSHDIMQNYDKSLKKSVREFNYDQFKKINLNDNFETKKNEFVSKNKDATDKLENSVNFRERKDTLSTNFPRSPISRDFHNLENSLEVESWKENTKPNQFQITEELRKLETEKNININTERNINSKNQKRNSILKRLNISKEDTKIKNEEIKSDKYRIADIEQGNHINLNKRIKMLECK